MIEEELIKIWQSSPNQERIKFEKSRLMIEVQASTDRLHRSIKYRDLREQIAALFVIPVFAYAAYTVPFVLTKIASVLTILWAIYVIMTLRNAKKHKPGAFTETYLEYLIKTRVYIDIQKRMIDSILYWYILPCWAIMSLGLAGFLGLPGKLKVIIQTEVLGIVVGIATYVLNKRAVKKELLP